MDMYEDRKNCEQLWNQANSFSTEFSKELEGREVEPPIRYGAFIDWIFFSLARFMNNTMPVDYLCRVVEAKKRIQKVDTTQRRAPKKALEEIIYNLAQKGMPLPKEVSEGMILNQYRWLRDDQACPEARYQRYNILFDAIDKYANVCLNDIDYDLDKEEEMGKKYCDIEGIQKKSEELRRYEIGLVDSLREKCKDDEAAPKKEDDRESIPHRRSKVVRGYLERIDNGERLRDLCDNLSMDIAQGRLWSIYYRSMVENGFAQLKEKIEDIRTAHSGEKQKLERKIERYESKIKEITGISALLAGWFKEHGMFENLLEKDRFESLKQRNLAACERLIERAGKCIKRAREYFDEEKHIPIYVE